MEGISQSIQAVMKLLEKSVQLWTHLVEDESLQDLQEKETKIHTTMAEVKQRHKTMTLPDKIKTATELKSLQLEEKALQAQKTVRQTLLEPLQEKADQLVMGSDATKKNIE